MFLKIRYYKFYDIIDLIEGIHLAKSNKIKKGINCHYWFFNHRFKCQNSVCNGCYDFSILSVNISNIVVIIVENVDYRCISHDITKSEAISLLKNCSWILWIYIKNSLNFQSIQDFFFYFFLLCYI